MKKSILFVTAAAVIGFAVPASADDLAKVDDPTPNGQFSDSENTGYASVSTDGARACNENPNTPAGDQVTGYAWISASGESTEPTYGDQNIGAGDADGEGSVDEDVDNDGVLDEGEDTNGNGQLDVQTHDCP